MILKVTGLIAGGQLMQADYSNTEQVIPDCKTSDMFNSCLVQILTQTQTIILSDDSHCFTKSLQANAIVVP